MFSSFYNPNPNLHQHNKNPGEGPPEAAKLISYFRKTENKFCRHHTAGRESSGLGCGDVGSQVCRKIKRIKYEITGSYSWMLRFGINLGLQIRCRCKFSPEGANGRLSLKGTMRLHCKLCIFVFSKHLTFNKREPFFQHKPSFSFLEK